MANTSVACIMDLPRTARYSYHYTPQSYVRSVKEPCGSSKTQRSTLKGVRQMQNEESSIMDHPGQLLIRHYEINWRPGQWRHQLKRRRKGLFLLFFGSFFSFPDSSLKRTPIPSIAFRNPLPLQSAKKFVEMLLIAKPYCAGLGSSET